MRSLTVAAAFYLAIFNGALLTSGALYAADNASSLLIDTAVTSVTMQSVQSLVFYPSRNAPASTQALNHSQIPAQIDALVNAMLVRVGDKVTKDQPVALLDCTQATLNVNAQQAQYQQLKINYQFQQRQLKRGNNLAKRKTIGDVELDQINTSMLSARALLSAQQSRVDQARLNQTRCKIIAPFNGMVTKRLVNVGEMVAPGRSIISLVQLDNVEVTANVALNDTQSFNQAKAFYFESSAQQYPLTRRILLPLVLDQTRSRQARLNFSKQSAMPGLTGRLIWVAARAHLPANMLQQRGDHYGVFVVIDQHAKFVTLTDAQAGRPIAINMAHQWTNYPLAIDGRHGLLDGQIVSIKDQGIAPKITNKVSANLQTGAQD